MSKKKNHHSFNPSSGQCEEKNPKLQLLPRKESIAHMSKVPTAPGDA